LLVCQVVYHRSTEQQKLAGSGRMLAIGLGVDDIRPLIGKHAGLEVACINSPQSTVVAGPEELLERLRLLLPSSVSSTFLRGSIAFHSSYTDPARPSLHAALTRALGPRPAPCPLLPIISTVTGQPLMVPCDATYLCDNMSQPVLFQTAIEHAFAFEPTPGVMLEVSATTLTAC
jgi:acyl transferase domain-containing protein